MATELPAHKPTVRAIGKHAAEGWKRVPEFVASVSLRDNGDIAIHVDDAKPECSDFWLNVIIPREVIVELLKVTNYKTEE